MPLISEQDIQVIVNKYIPNNKIINGKCNINIFRKAFRHATVAKDHTDSYERLELLGDAVLRLIITHYFFLRYPNEDGGFLTKIKIAIEKRESLVELTKKLELYNFLQIGMNPNDHIYEDICESFIGAFYSNYDFDYTYLLVVNILEKEKDFASILYYNDNYKDILLRYFHKMKWGFPVYEHPVKNSCNVIGPNGNVIGTGHGYTKKIAEQNASKNALIKLKIIKNNEIIEWDQDSNQDEDNDESDNDEDDGKKNKILPIYNRKNKLLTPVKIQNLFNKYNLDVKSHIINIDLFIEGVTHPSYIKRENLNEIDFKIKDKCVELRDKHYGRMQFLGGAVIHLIIAELLFDSYLDRDEGFMTRIRSRLENRETLFILAKAIGIDKYVLISHRIELMKGRDNINIITSSFSGFLGAMYLNVGYYITKYPLIILIKNVINLNEIIETETNYKELLIALYIKNKWGAPVYEVLDEKGPDHSKRFIVCVRDFSGNIIAKDIGSSKKQAEKKVAKKVYHKLLNYLENNKN